MIEPKDMPDEVLATAFAVLFKNALQMTNGDESAAINLMIRDGTDHSRKILAETAHRRTHPVVIAELSDVFDQTPVKQKQMIEMFEDYTNRVFAPVLDAKLKLVVECIKELDRRIAALERNNK